MLVKKRTTKKFKLKPLEEVNRRFNFGAGKHTSEFWDFARDGASVSGLTTFLQCREQFRLQYVEGLQSNSYSMPMEWGSFFHFLHAQWVCGATIGKKDVDIYRKQWNAEHSTLTSKDKEMQETSYASALAVWETYKDIYEDDLKRDWQTAEEHFRQKIVLPDGRETVIRGFMDGTFIEKGLRLHEMKTKGQINLQQIEQCLWIDLQVMAYILILYLQGKKPVGVQYDLIRRPGSKPHKKESLQAYRKRITRDVAKEPKYYFARIDLEVPKCDVDDFRTTMLEPMLMDLGDWAEGKLRHYPSPEALVGKYGPCSMYNAIVNNDRTNLASRRSVSRNTKV